MELDQSEIVHSSDKSSLDRRIVLLFCIIYPGITFTVFVATFPLWIIPWINEFGSSHSLLMTGIAVGGLVSLLMTPVVGWSIIRFSPRYLITFGSIILSTGLLLAAFSNSAIIIVALYSSLIPIGRSFAGALLAQTVSIKLFPNSPSFVNSLVLLGPSMIGVLLIPVAALSLEHYGWRHTFVIQSVMVLLLIPAAFLILRMNVNSFPPKKIENETVKHHSTVKNIDILKTKLFWLPLLGAMPILFAYSGIQPNIVSITSDIGLSIPQSSYIVSTLSLGSIIGTLTIGWLGDKIDNRLLYIFLAILMLIAFGLFRISDTVTPLIIASLALGITAGGASPLLGAIVIQRFGPHNFPVVFGLIGPFLMPGMAGPVIVGLIKDVTDSYSLVFAIFSLLTIPGIIAMCLIGRSVYSRPISANSGETAGSEKG